MAVRKIRRHFQGERALLVEPEIRDTLDDDALWHRRLLPNTGSSLTDLGLRVEQRGRDGRLSSRGQAVSEGVVHGLDVEFEPPPGANGFPLPLTGAPALPELGHLTVGPGHGLAANGEDVVLPSPIRAPLSRVPVVGAPVTDPSEPQEPTLGQFLRDHPRSTVGILVLEPVVMEIVGRALTQPDVEVLPCERDPSDDPFDDWRWADGVRLAFHLWPEVELGPLTLRKARNRNLIAHQVFELEQARNPELGMPWAEAGVAVGLLGIVEEKGSGIFVDRWSVARLGGRPKRRRPIVPRSGYAGLWQARMEQFADQFASEPVTPDERAIRRFRKLPPIGVLPRQLVTLEPATEGQPGVFTTSFFPDNIAVELSPIPMEQLDQVARWATPLDPIELRSPGEVKLLVPVPQRWFDPELLVEEQVHPTLLEAFGHALRSRDRRLAHRAFLRAQLGHVEQALAGPNAVTQFPQPDPDALDADEMASAGPFLWENGDLLQVLSEAAASNDPLEAGRLVAVGDAIAGIPAVGAPVAQAFGGDHDTDSIIVVDGIDEGHLRIPGATLDRGWVRPDVVGSLDRPFDRPQLHYASATVYLVAGRLHEAVLDRALEFADHTPLIIVASSLDDRMLTRIDRLREDGRLPPLVVLGLRGPRLLEKAADLAIRLGATPRPLGDEWGTLAGIQEAVVTRRRTWLVGPKNHSAPTALARGQEIQALLDAARSEAEATRLQQRLAALSETVSVVTLTPDSADPNAKWRAGHRAFVALKRYVDAIRGARDAGVPIDWALLGSVLGGSPLVDPLSVTETGLSSGPYEGIGGVLLEPSSKLKEKVAVLEASGLRGLAQEITEELREANEVVTVSTVRLQTDMFRVRKLLMGNATATRFATSPILAQLARELRSDASSRDVLDLLEKLKGVAVPNPTEPELPAEEARPNWIIRAEELYKPQFSAVVLDRFDQRHGPRLSRFTASAPTFLGTLSSVQPTTLGTPQPEGPSSASTNATRAWAPSMDLTDRTGISERLDQPESLEARLGSFNTKTSTLGAMKDLRINLQGIEFPLQVKDGARKSFDIDTDTAIVDGVLKGDDDPDSGSGDEASVLSKAISSLEVTLTWIRLVEARIRSYEEVLDDTREAIQQLRTTRRKLQRQLQRRFTDLAEARHDVEVSRALLEEEQTRIDDLNAWRRSVLTDRVPFVVFCRPREVEATDQLPVHDVQPALIQSPVPDCLSRPAAAPDDLRDLVEMIRDAPGRWFPEIRERLDEVDRLERLRAFLEWIHRRARARAQQALQQRSLRFPSEGIARSLVTVLDLREERLVNQRKVIAAAALRDLGSWRRGRQQLDEMVSIGDLVESREVGAGLSKAASQLLENIHRVAACLYEELGTVEPRIRVQWALRMSEFDEPVDLRELAALPLWRDVGSNERLERGDPLLRAELQALVDWLYQQVDVEDEEAVALISDVVRVCVLLSSHAPVDRIVAGHIEEAAPVRLGGLVPLRVNPGSLRIGMTVWLHKAGSRVARGVIADLEDQRASARIVEATQPGVVLQQGDPVRILDDLQDALPLQTMFKK